MSGHICVASQQFAAPRERQDPVASWDGVPNGIRRLSPTPQVAESADSPLGPRSSLRDAVADRIAQAQSGGGPGKLRRLLAGRQCLAHGPFKSASWPVSPLPIACR